MKDKYDATFDYLKAKGVLNVDAPDFSEIQEPTRYERAAYCASSKCARSKTRVEKPGLSMETVYCPDCGHALIWQCKKRLVVE